MVSHHKSFLWTSLYFRVEYLPMGHRLMLSIVTEKIVESSGKFTPQKVFKETKKKAIQYT